MSYSTWTNYGRGICVDEIETTKERIDELLKRAPEYEEEIRNNLGEILSDQEEDYEITLEDYENIEGEYGINGLGEILRMVIEEAEGIEFSLVDNFNCENFLLYSPNYPWHMSEKEKNLTEETVDDIFKKYVSILTDTPIEIGYHSVENGG